MKPAIWKLCILLLLLPACSNDPVGPSIWEVPLVNTQFTVGPGTLSAVSFSVDLSQMEAPSVVGSISVAGNQTESLNVLILNTTNFTLWESGEPYVAVFESGQTHGRTIEVPITTSETFVLAFSNRADTTASKTAQAAISLFFQQSTPQ